MKFIHSFCIILLLAVLTSCGQAETKNESNEPVNSEASSETQVEETTVKFLWREMKYDSTLNDSFNSIFINQEYANTISDPEKAAIGYVATFIGNECWWDGDTKEDRSNLDCKVITALGLGYQCSEGHLGFLRNWFAADKAVLTELENCPTTPYTATVQDTFEEIVVKTKGDTIIVEYKATGMNLREGKNWEWSEKVHFQVNGDHLNLIKKDKSDVNQSELEVTEG